MLPRSPVTTALTLALTFLAFSAAPAFGEADDGVPTAPVRLPVFDAVATLTEEARDQITEGAEKVDERFRRRELKVIKRSRTPEASVRRSWLHRKIDEKTADRHRATLEAAREAARSLGGARGRAMRNALRDVERLAAAGMLTSDRLHPVLETLRRNTDWWTRRGAPVGKDVSRNTDPMTLRHIAGHGLVLHQLASWGRVNSLARNCLDPQLPCDEERVRSAVDRLVSFGVVRDGVLRFESTFSFGGAAAPWISGMTQGTAVQALTRAAQILDDPSYLDTARQALEAFAHRPPLGVSIPVGEHGGRHFLMYSTKPGLRVLNGHLRAIRGLRDLALRGDSGKALALYRRGEKGARNILKATDTGAWSLYSRGGAESSVHYHDLTTDFLADLCKDDAGQRYCAARKRFRRYMWERTRIGLHVSHRPRARSQAGIKVWISKVSDVRITVKTASGKTVFSRRGRLERGSHRFGFVPRRHGKHDVRVTAVGPGGAKAGVETGTILVLRSQAEVDAAKRKKKAEEKRKAEAKEKREAEKKRKEKKRKEKKAEAEKDAG